MGMKKFIAALIGILCIPGSPGNTAGRETCFASVDKTSAFYDEKIQYVITVTYAVNTLPPVIVAPVFEKFRIIDDFSVITEAGSSGNRYKVQKRTWVLKPAGTGRLTITPAVVTFRDPVSGMQYNERLNLFHVDVGNNESIKGERENGRRTSNQSLGTIKNKKILYAIISSVTLVFIMFTMLYFLRKKQLKHDNY